VVEFDSVPNLLKNKNSNFAGILQKIKEANEL